MGLRNNFECDDDPAVVAFVVVDKVIEDNKDKGDGWKDVDVAVHIDHAIAHLKALKAKDTSEHHLNHALCRVAMATSLLRKGNGRGKG